LGRRNPLLCIININAVSLRVVMYSPRIYLYKITFEEVSYYYYGVHKEKKFDEYYMGSPVTHKWCWELYTSKKQILQLFDFTDEGWIEAQEVEKRLIKPFYNTDKWCLNEHCGGKISLKMLSEAGKFNRGKNNPSYGKAKSEETKMKISLANKGRVCEPFTEEHKKKISEANKGRKMTEKQIQKRLKSIVGKYKGKNNKNTKKHYLTFDDGTITIVEDGIVSWAKKYGYAVSGLYELKSGKRKNYKNIIKFETQ
jgi:hypothetical protein